MMTIAKMRMKIALDAIEQVEAGKIRIKAGHSGYVKLPESKSPDILDSKDSLIPLIKRGCKACALGALFITDIKKHNGFRLKDLKETRETVLNMQQWKYIQRDDVFKRLRAYFSSHQLEMIENAFEGDEEYGEEWKKKYPSSDDRFIAICKNIITNDGHFKRHRV